MKRDVYILCIRIKIHVIDKYVNAYSMSLDNITKRLFDHNVNMSKPIKFNVKPEPTYDL